MKTVFTRLLLTALCAAAAFVYAPAAMATPAVSLSVSPAIGVSPYPATLTWSATGALSCTASDGWTGTKATSGTQAVTISAATKFTLTCTAADGSVKVSWSTPTVNTDGTALTDLASFNIYRGTTPSNLASIKTAIPVGSSSYLNTGIASGTYIYAVTAVNSANVESAKSNLSSSVVAGSTGTQSTTAALQSIPAPPTSVTATVIDATAWEIRPNTQGTMLASRIGVIAMGSVCSSETRTASGVTYNRVDPRSVDLFTTPSQIPPRDVFALCAAT